MYIVALFAMLENNSHVPNSVSMYFVTQPLFSETTINVVFDISLIFG